MDPTFISEPLVDFPVLVRLTDTRLAQARADGADLFFSLDGGESPLPFDVELFDRVTGTLVAWVRLSAVASSGPTAFFLRYADGVTLVSRANAPGTWPSSFAAVFHMDSAGGAAAQRDSTVNANHASPDTVGCSSPSVTRLPEGVAGSALNFGGLPCTRLIAPDSNSLDISTALTVSAWVYPTTNGTTATEVVVAKRVRTNERANYQVGLKNAPHDMYMMWGPGPVGQYPNIRSVPSAAPAQNAWSHLVWVVSGGTRTLRLYINGVRINGEQTMANEGTNATLNSAILLTLNNEPLFVGGMDQETDEPFRGSLDEVRISNVERSPAWIRAEHENQRAGSTFLRIADAVP